MLRALFLILMLGLGSWGYQTWIADQPDYIQTLQTLYYGVVSATVFWGAGLFKSS